MGTTTSCGVRLLTWWETRLKPTASRAVETCSSRADSSTFALRMASGAETKALLSRTASFTLQRSVLHLTRGRAAQQSTTLTSMIASRGGSRSTRSVRPVHLTAITAFGITRYREEMLLLISTRTRTRENAWTSETTSLLRVLPAMRLSL